LRSVSFGSFFTLEPYSLTRQVLKLHPSKGRLATSEFAQVHVEKKNRHIFVLSLFQLMDNGQIGKENNTNNDASMLENVPIG
jgi:hypothetical protein